MSKSLTVKVPLTEAFENDKIFIKAAQADLVIPLEAGKHSVNTAAVEVGYLKEDGQPLRASMEFPYEYYEADGIVIDESDFVSKNPVRLMVGKDGNTEFCRLSAFDGYGDLTLKEPYWKYDESRSGGLKAHLQKSLAEVSNLVGNSAKESGLLVLKNINISNEAEKYSILYRDGRFAGIIDITKDSEMNIGDEYKVIPIKSTGAKAVDWPKGMDFANVIGSTKDPKINGKTWIQLYVDLVHPRNIGICGSQSFNGFSCNATPSNPAVGGHVLLGTTKAKEVAPGSDFVYIVPICRHHNSADVAMRNIGAFSQAVALTAYFK